VREGGRRGEREGGGGRERYGILEGGYPAETKIHTTISSLKNYDIY
jgi:hypothetical protein